MSSKIAKFGLGKVVGKKTQQYEPPDPHYETYTDTKGRTKKRKRALPADLTPLEQKVLLKVRRRAHYLDKGMNLCGFRVGWTFFIALIPVVGDLADAALGYNLVIKQAKKADIPVALLTKMQFNTILATGIGMIPLAGDIIMAAFKPNSRNAILFEEFLVQRSKQRGPGAVSVPAGEDAQAAQVIDRAKQGSWSLRDGTNDNLAAGEPREGVASTSGASGPPGTSYAVRQPPPRPTPAGQPTTQVKVAPPVPPR